MRLARVLLSCVICLFFTSCTSVEIVESPRTGYVPENAPSVEPAIVWTSRTLPKSFEYLGNIKIRSWTYEGALDELVAAAKGLRADAVTDVHYERVGFLKTIQGFAIKYK